MAKTKAKPAAKSVKPKKAKKAASAHDAEEANERRTAEKVMAAVLEERKAEEEAPRVDVWVEINCPFCGETADLHVIAEMDGQSLDQDCHTCARAFVAHVEIDEGEAHVSVESA